MVETIFCVNDRSERSFETVLGHVQVSTSVETVLSNFRALVETVFNKLKHVLQHLATKIEELLKQSLRIESMHYMMTLTNVSSQACRPQNLRSFVI